MIIVKLEDFEIYRLKLFKYALGLLRSQGSNGTLYIEQEENAKDIVQDCYLRFHNHYKDAFVSKEHLFNFLKLCLYRSYQKHTDPKTKNCQYSLFKDLTQLEWIHDNPPKSYVYEYKSKEYIDKFIETLTFEQQKLMIKLLEGFTQLEISGDMGVTKQAINYSLGYIKKKYERYRH